MRAIREHRWKWIAAAAIVLLVGWYLVEQVRRRGFQWKLFLYTLSGLDWRWLALASLLSLATYYGRALRWAVLMRPVRPRARMWSLTVATVIGFTAITIFGRPGELVRPYLISARERVPFSSQLAALLLERIFDLLMALLVFGYALSRVQNSTVAVGSALSWVLAFGGRFVAIACLVCFAILLLFRHFSEPMRKRLLDSLRFLSEHHYRRADKLITAFIQGLESTRSYSAVVLLTSYSVVEWVLIAACYYCAMNAFGTAVHFSLTDVLILMGFIAFGAVFQIPGVGGGVQIVCVLVLTELFKMPLEVATSIALLLWIISFVVVVPVGLVLAFHEGINWNKLKCLEPEMEA